MRRQPPISALLGGLFGGSLGGQSRADLVQMPLEQLRAHQEAMSSQLFNQAFGTPLNGLSDFEAALAGDWHRQAFADRRRERLKAQVKAADGDFFLVFIEESRPTETFFEWLEREGL